MGRIERCLKQSDVRIGLFFYVLTGNVVKLGVIDIE